MSALHTAPLRHVSLRFFHLRLLGWKCYMHTVAGRELKTFNRCLMAHLGQQASWVLPCLVWLYNHMWSGRVLVIDY